ncbi:cation diffusion facilitator family transporter [Desulfofustis glycolicus DSM 9705]|uniref:Cation diffusion facilitator family transporter n=2 Tax=Desulfofustis glycolicus TaxID=51195 RepID=A0A1M5Y0Q1_9BACT|nr:cation diffusion facilitator family transporter [Desulfofustis glycolicus DSM 9705]
MTEGWLSILGNGLLFVLKLWVGLVTGSVALTADAWHTLTDSISSLLVVVSALFSRKPADNQHPFGHGRADLICSVMIGVMLAMIGLEFVVKAIGQLQSGISVSYGLFAIAVTIISIVVKEALAQFAFWAGRRTANPMLRADGWHHRSDALSSVVVLVGILLGGSFWWMDGVLGIIVAVMIFYAAYDILRHSVDRLIGEPPDKELLARLEGVINELRSDIQPHHYHLHRYGDHVELTFHVTMAPDLTLREAHDRVHVIEQTLRDRFNIEATIHMDPEGV